MEDRWVTTQIAPLPVPGLMACNMPIVAFLLQHREDAPTITRAVAAILENGVLHPVAGTPNAREGEWWKLTE